MSDKLTTAANEYREADLAQHQVDLDLTDHDQTRVQLEKRWQEAHQRKSAAWVALGEAAKMEEFEREAGY